MLRWILHNPPVKCPASFSRSSSSNLKFKPPLSNLIQRNYMTLGVSSFFTASPTTRDLPIMSYEEALQFFRSAEKTSAAFKTVQSPASSAPTNNARQEKPAQLSIGSAEKPLASSVPTNNPTLDVASPLFGSPLYKSFSGWTQS